MNKDDLAKSLDVIGKAKVAATSGIELGNIADAVAQEYQEHGRLPLMKFGRFLKDSMMEKGGKETRDRSKDLWQTPYRLVLDVPKNGFVVWSAGPDKFWGNDDDLRYPRSLTGLGGRNALDPADIQIGRNLATAFAAYDANQPAAGSAAATGSGPGTDEPSTSTARARSPNPPEATAQRVLESQMRRAEQGSPTAQLDMGRRLATGDGVEQDKAKARKYLEQALENLATEAQRDEARQILEQLKQGGK